MTKNDVPRWPRSAVLCVVLLVLSFSGLVAVVYTRTRDAYRSVGFNDGRVYEREQILKKVEQTVVISDCRKESADTEKIELLSVKAHALHIIRSDDNRVHFCRY